jgi:hypothetical protein
VFRRGGDLVLLHSKIPGEIEGTRRSSGRVILRM